MVEMREMSDLMRTRLKCMRFDRSDHVMSTVSYTKYVHVIGHTKGDALRAARREFVPRVLQYYLLRRRGGGGPALFRCYRRCYGFLPPTFTDATMNVLTVPHSNAEEERVFQSDLTE